MMKNNINLSFCLMFPVFHEPYEIGGLLCYKGTSAAAVLAFYVYC